MDEYYIIINDKRDIQFGICFSFFNLFAQLIATFILNKKKIVTTYNLLHC